MRLELINVRLADWIFSAFQRMPHVLVMVGYPDPRENARGGIRSLGETVGDTDPSSQNYALQQNELLFRGMSELREDFLFVTLTSPLSTPIIVRMLTGLAEETSTWASLQQGVRGATFGVSLPAALVASVADQAGLIRKRLIPLTLTHTATSRSIPESVRDAWQWIIPY